jgi:hypothetical protein
MISMVQVLYTYQALPIKRSSSNDQPSPSHSIKVTIPNKNPTSQNRECGKHTHTMTGDAHGEITAGEVGKQGQGAGGKVDIANERLEIS